MRLLAIPAVIAALAFTTLAAADAHADTAYETGVVSLGVGLGDPTALDLKLWTTNSSGFDFGFGLENFDDVFGLYGEYEFGIVDFRLGDSGGRGVFYIGVGGAVAFTPDRTTAAVIIPVGVDFRFAAPIDLFIEARPGVNVSHGSAFGIGGQLGLRFRFR